MTPPRIFRALPLLILLAGCGGDADKRAPAQHSCRCCVPENSEVDATISDTVYFAPGSASPDAAAYAALEKQAEWLKKYPSVKVTVTGYADDSGDAVKDLRLGLRRAAAVKRYLMELGVDFRRIKTRYASLRQKQTASGRKAVTAVD